MDNGDDGNLSTRRVTRVDYVLPSVAALSVSPGRRTDMHVTEKKAEQQVNNSIMCRCAKTVETVSKRCENTAT